MLRGTEVKARSNLSRIVRSEFTAYGIPEKREPEFGFMFTDMGDHATIYNHLSAHPDIRVTVPWEKPADKFLVSFAEDTVDADGYPTQGVSTLSLERRRRVSLITADNSFVRSDISFKDAHKSTMRREWEANSTCLSSGDADILAKVAADVPGAAHLKLDSFRTSGICITSRASYAITHFVDRDTCVEYELCNDACVLTNPHADRVLGYRKEVELEGKEILSGSAHTLSVAELHDVLDRSLETIETYLKAANFRGEVRDASISKVRHTNAVVKADYEQAMPTYRGLNGLDWAVMQNVRAWDYTFEGRREVLGRLTTLIPSPRLLMPGVDTRHIEGYFPEQQKYKAFPDFHA